MPARAARTASLPALAVSLLAQHRFLVVLVAADVASKVAAFQLLPDGRAVTLLPGLRLFLAVNEWGVMGGVQGIGAITANSTYTLLLALGLLGFALVVHRLGSSSLAFGRRLFAGTLVFFAVAFAAQTLAKPFAEVSLPVDTIVSTIRLAVLMLALAFYSASSAPLPRAAFTLLAAGALANALSYTYPPFEVVDFLVVPLAPLGALLGSGAAMAGDTAVGVINLADLYVFAFPLLLLAWPPLAALRRLRRRGLLSDATFARLRSGG